MTEQTQGLNGDHEGVEPNLGERLFRGLEVFADIGISLGKSTDALVEQIRKQNEMLQKNTPIDYQKSDVQLFVSGTLLLNLGSPDQGTYWEVGSVVIGGTDLNVVAAGQAGLYVSGTPMFTGGMTNAADWAPTLPNIGFYGKDQLVLNSGEYLLAVIFNGTPGQQYAASASAKVFNVAAARGVTVTAT